MEGQSEHPSSLRGGVAPDKLPPAKHGKPPAKKKVRRWAMDGGGTGGDTPKAAASNPQALGAGVPQFPQPEEVGGGSRKPLPHPLQESLRKEEAKQPKKRE